MFGNFPCCLWISSLSKSVQKRGKSPCSAISVLQFDTSSQMKNRVWCPVMGCLLSRCEMAFDLSPYFCLRVEKCHRSRFKRFWKVLRNVVCKRNACFACILSVRKNVSPTSVCFRKRGVKPPKPFLLGGKGWGRGLIPERYPLTGFLAP